MPLLWTERYRPKTLSDVVDNREALDKLKAWLAGWEKGVPRKRAAFLYGPPGIGKTASSEALANDFQYDYFELNASDYRSADRIQRLIRRKVAMTTTLHKKRRLVIVDEVEGIHKRGDKGGLPELVEAIRRTRVPMILIANDYWNRILRDLRAVSEPTEFTRPPIPDIVARLKLICRKEGVKVNEDRLESVAEQSGGDLRSAINDLQTLVSDERLEPEELGMGERTRKERIFDVVRNVFQGRDIDKAFEQVYLRPEELFDWIYENAPYQLRSSESLAAAMDVLSEADVYLKRSWRERELRKYFYELMTRVASHSDRGGGGPIYSPGKRRGLLYARSWTEREARKRIAQRISQRCHVSPKKAWSEFAPFLRVIFRSNDEMASGLAEWLDLDPRSVTLLRG